MNAIGDYYSLNRDVGAPELGAGLGLRGEYYPNAEFYVIEREGIPAGRLYLERWSNEIRVMDIALLPEHQSAGIGTKLLQDLQTEAARVGKKVSMHVEKWNPALQLYDRLGFKVIEDKGVNYLVEWKPE